MPEVTDNFVRIPVDDIANHEGHEIRTIEISAKDGIKAIYCVTDKMIITYLFDKGQWTLETAQAWVNEHGKAFDFFECGLEIKAVKAGKDGGLTIEGYASTFAEDRDQEIIDKAAFNDSMTEYMKNPIVLVGHENKPENVIGKVEDFKIDDKGLWVRIKLIKPVTDFAKQVIQNIQDGVLKALSIGGLFEKIKNIIKRVDLMEISVVPVPANPGCLFSLAKALKSVGFKEMKAEKTEPDFDDLFKSLQAEVAELKTKLAVKEEAAIEAVPAEEAPAASEAEKPDVENIVKENGVEGKIIPENISKEDSKMTEGNVAVLDEAKVADIVKAGIEDYKKSLHAESKIEFPVGDRQGNLAIEDKQLFDLVSGKSQTVTMVGGKAMPFMFKGGKVLGQKGVAMDTAENGGGSQWIPTELAGQLIDLIRVKALSYSLFEEWKMSSPTFNIPILTTDPSWIIQGEATDDSTAKAASSNAGTGNVSLVSVKLGAKVAFSTELDEDVTIGLLPSLKDTVTNSGADSLEDAVINGDTTGTHQDSDVTVATDVRKAWKGLRKLAIAGSCTKDMSTFNADTFYLMLGSMGIYGANVADLAIIAAPKTFWGQIALLRDSGNYNAVFQPDKNALGGLGYIAGIPVIVSSKVRTNVNDSGVYDGTTTTKATVVIVNRKYFKTGSKRALTFKTDFNGDRDQNELFVTMRNAFSPVQTPSTTISSVWLGIKF
jgi:HK97 family phage prohead protease/HK97 family phage major capsid protein